MDDAGESSGRGAPPRDDAGEAASGLGISRVDEDSEVGGCVPLINEEDDGSKAVRP